MIDPRPDLDLRDGYHSPQVDVAVRLNTNESPGGPPEGWARQLRDIVLPSIDWNRYPDRTAGELRAAIAAAHGVDPSWVYVANGSNEVLQSVLLAYGGPDRTAALFEPTYALHSHIARITGTRVCIGSRAADFSVDLEEVERIVEAEHPSVLFLCSPNNPTGVVDPPEVIGAVAQLATDRGALLVMDEAYGQFAPWSAQELLAPERPLVVARTFSKTWAMAGARLGYCLAPPSVVTALDGVTLPYHLDSFKQAAGVAALGWRDEMESRIEGLVAERARLVEGLGALGVTVWPSGANFVLFRADGRDGSEVWQALVDRSVLIRDCSSWPALPGCLRVTVGTPEEDDRFLDALREVLVS